jgi:HD-GYP domain-containing protein (c-di-GMP phosphodiesterase class II)
VDAPGSRSTVEVRAAELIGTLSRATDLAIGVPLEHGLQSTLIAMRLAELLGVDQESASQTYYACLLFYVGCTATAELGADIFGSEDALTRYATPFRFGSRRQMISGMIRAVAPPDNVALDRLGQVARAFPKLIRKLPEVVAINCEVALLFSDRLGLPAGIGQLFGQISERWDGKGEPGLAAGDDLSLAMRIVHVARDAAFQLMLGGPDFAVQVVRERAGHAFDPLVSACLVDQAPGILAIDEDASLWSTILAAEPSPHLNLDDQHVDQAVAAMGDFTDLVSPYLVGHSGGVAALAAAAAVRLGLDADQVADVRRAALIHDIGRVAVPTRIWSKPGALNPDEWERVRLHAYHSERILSRSSFLHNLIPISTAHHERIDGSGYHRGTLGTALPPLARLLAAADTYHAITEPRAHRPAFSLQEAAAILGEEVRAGRLDREAVSAVLEARGPRLKSLARPAGLTDREVEVVGLLARGLLTKQIAHQLGISAKTADRHVQNAYRKINVSTRAAATLFAMQHGLVAWGELPISIAERRP